LKDWHLQITCLSDLENLICDLGGFEDIFKKGLVKFYQLLSNLSEFSVILIAFVFHW